MGALEMLERGYFAVGVHTLWQRPTEVVDGVSEADEMSEFSHAQCSLLCPTRDNHEQGIES